MNTHVCRCARAQNWMIPCAWLLVAGVATLWSGKPLAASESLPTVVRVEEDWELVVRSPDPDSIAPQVTCAISPTGQLDSFHATLELNHQSQPDFTPGGIQLQLWNGESLQSSHKYPQDTILSLAGETVRWTQTMTLENGVLVFEVVAGESVTWGSFGGQGYLRAAVSSQLPNLNTYDPSVSVQNSAVGYAANRVESLVLKAVRVVTSTGEVFEDVTPRDVHLQD